MGRYANRAAIMSALDSLVGWGGDAVWTGNVVEVWHKASNQGHTHITEYLILKVLRERGKSLGRGQYRVRRKDLH